MNTSTERLALFLPGLYDGGAERIVLNLAKGISARGYAVDLVLARAEGPYMEQVPAAVRLIDLKAPRVLQSVPALVKYLRQEHPTVLLSAMFANVIAVWARRLSGIPHRLVLTEQNTLSSLVRNKADVRWKLYPRLASWFYPWADHVVAVSKYVADDLVQIARIPAERVELIYNPIVTPELLEKSKAPVQHPWFCEDQPPVIVGIGRLTDQKAFDVLIQAFSIVRKKRLARLVILGEGENRAALASLVQQLKLENDVDLVGYWQNPYPFVTHAAAFTLPSRWEGLPTILVEALYLGARIVATDCPGGTSEILKGGQYGKLVPVEDPLSLAEAIDCSLDSQQPCYPRESWEPFHLDVVLDRYINLLFGAL